MRIWFPTIVGNSGADIYTRRLARALTQRNIDVHIDWLPTAYQFAPSLLSRRPPPPGTRVVHANSWSAFAFKRANLPLVVTEHHCVFDPAYRPHQNLPQFLYHNRVIRRYAMRSYALASAVVAVSEFTAQSLRTAAGLTDVDVLPNFIDTNRYRPAEVPRHARPRPFRLLFVGNPTSRKGGDLLEPIMLKLGSDFELRFTSGLRGEIRGNYPKNMIPLGRLDEADLIRAYQECDALLYPSRFEGFGYSALEAMACGKPVVASDSTALPEVTLDGVTGFLCKIGDIDGFAEACRRLAGDDTLRAQLGNNARNRAVGHFSEEVAIQRYLALYERVAGECR